MPIMGLLTFFMTSTGLCENIDPYDSNAQYAYGENIGWVNFEPNLVNINVGAQVSNKKIEGFIWAENIGWINLSPQHYGGVFNDGCGNLSGYAWGENVGWINFSPTVLGYQIPQLKDNKSFYQANLSFLYEGIPCPLDIVNLDTALNIDVNS